MSNSNNNDDKTVYICNTKDVQEPISEMCRCINSFYNYWIDKDTKNFDAISIFKSAVEYLHSSNVHIYNVTNLIKTDESKVKKVLSIPRKASQDIITSLKKDRDTLLSNLARLKSKCSELELQY